MVNNQQKIIIFENQGSKSIWAIISEVLKDNGMEETAIDFFKKVDEKKIPFSSIIYKLSRKLAQEEITEENFVTSIKDQLKIEQQVAEKILKDVKEKILPLARTLEKDELVKDETISTVPQSLKTINKNFSPATEKNNINISGSEILANEPIDSLPKNETQNIANTITPATIETPTKRIRKPLPKKPFVPETQPTQPSKPDSYREPIE
ncbi:MAG: hypothetical protein WC711_03110 [Candidatus Staskawiczbacteria bacterium]|jgi:predicted RNA-binding protein with RPS1 domain